MRDIVRQYRKCDFMCYGVGILGKFDASLFALDILLQEYLHAGAFERLVSLVGLLVAAFRLERRGATYVDNPVREQLSFFQHSQS